MDVVSAVIALVGLVLIVLGIVDIFFTILHPDRDGPVSVALNRLTWAMTVTFAQRFPAIAGEFVAAAGGIMIALTIVLWMILQVVGFALLAWPFMATGFVSDHPGAITLVDALYWSGVTFTTLGYGDILPATPLWKLVATVEALAGFALVGAAITFLLSVFQGIEHRDKIALRIYSETRRTWDGTVFVLRVLNEEGEHALMAHVATWADQMRELHERLYRFQPLAFYVRTRSEKHDPERMLEAVGEVALTARILAQRPEYDSLRPAADEMDIAYTEFALSAIRHHGSRRAVRALASPEPTDADRDAVARIRGRVDRRLVAEGAAPGNADEDLAVLVLAARIRLFLDELDRITRWRTIRGVM